MKLSKEKMLRAAERVLKRTEAYREKRELGYNDNYQIAYLLKKGKNATPENVIAYADDKEQFISFFPFKSDELTYNWDFNFDGDLFEYLQSGYELVDMMMDCHVGVWATIEEWHNGDIDNVRGMQKYLAYCKQKGITKENLGYDGMDVMSLYDPKAERTNSHKEMER